MCSCAMRTRSQYSSGSSSACEAGRAGERGDRHGLVRHRPEQAAGDLVGERLVARAARSPGRSGARGRRRRRPARAGSGRAPRCRRRAARAARPSARSGGWRRSPGSRRRRRRTAEAPPGRARPARSRNVRARREQVALRRRVEEDRLAAGGQERVAPDLLAALDRLQQEARPEVAHPQVGGDRRQEVGGQLAHGRPDAGPGAGSGRFGKASHGVAPVVGSDHAPGRDDVHRTPGEWEGGRVVGGGAEPLRAHADASPAGPPPPGGGVGETRHARQCAGAWGWCQSGCGAGASRRRDGGALSAPPATSPAHALARTAKRVVHGRPHGRVRLWDAAFAGARRE